MMFREYGEVIPMTITTNSQTALDARIEEIGRNHDIIDLQFATSYDNKKDSLVYSALLLVKEAK